MGHGLAGVRHSPIGRLLKMAVSGTKVYYLTGNHDDLLRKFGELSFGLIHLRNKLVFQIEGRTHWVFHGDVFDASIQRARWLARLGGEGYDLVLLGTNGPTTIDLDRIDERIKAPDAGRLRESLSWIGCDEAAELFSFYIASGPQLAAWLADAQINRDANLRLQYLAGLGVNAGHDLNRDNLAAFLTDVPGVSEVSIGHALTADALEFGMRTTVGLYLAEIRKAGAARGSLG